MSASREKKTRQDLASAGWTDPKTVREAQQRKEAHRANVLYGIIGAAFLVVAVIAVIWKTNVIPKSVAAATVNGEKYTAAEVNFYYAAYYQNFLNNTYGLTSMIGLDTSAPLDGQTISDTAASFLPAMNLPEAEAGTSWKDYFIDRALEQLSGVQAMCDAAEAEGFAWDNEMQSELDETLDSLASSAASYGYSEQQYLSLVYGSTMTRGVFEEQSRRSILASAYMNAYQDSLTYTADELEAAYAEDPTLYDVVDCEYIRVSGSVPTTDDDGNEVEVTDEMKEEAMAAAKATADEIYASVQAGTSLEDAAGEYDSTAVYTANETYSYNTSDLGEWLYDDARQAGDTAVLEDADSEACFVVRFNSRGRYDYNTVNVRHILIQPEETELTEEDEGYEDDVAAKDEAAEAKAQEILTEWENGAATEESFAELANEYSEDPGSNTNGGLYEQVYQGYMVTEFNDWCFDPARQPGDTGIIHNDATGYHVMYFVGFGQPYWEIQVTGALVNEATDAWYDELTADYTAERSSLGMRFVG